VFFGDGQSEMWSDTGGLPGMKLRHRMTQQPPPSPFSNVRSAALVAASKTSSTPSPVKDEHSRYFRAPISCAISVASRVETKCWERLRISSMATGSSRRSFLRPTRIMGTLGQRSLASSTHWSLLAKSRRERTEKLYFVLNIVEGIGRVD
jgi:hypothetical protein